ncbi:MAG TPA: winged helix-turn-helix domain-containing protein [Povalibacter sp.]
MDLGVQEDAQDALNPRSLFVDINRLLRFGDFTLDTTQGLLFQGDKRLRLTPKLIALLTLLVERRGTIVSREEIICALWPNTIVEAGGLSRNISMLRKQLDPDQCSRYIENIPKRGYRFVAEVVEVASAHDQAANVSSPTAQTETPTSIEHATVATASSSRRWSRPMRQWAAALACIVVLAPAALAVLGVTREHREHSWRAVPITTNSAAMPILSADISSDGRLLAYIETNGADTSAYVRMLHSPGAHALPALPGVAPSAVHWYADNIHLLLSGFDPASRRYVAWSASTLGGPPIVVLNDAHRVALSPDGQQIAFYRNRSEIWLAASDGKSEQLFATAPGTDRFRLQPRFSLDGKYLIVGRVTRLPYSPLIEAHRLSDGQVTTLFDPNGRAVFDMLLRPNGELIVSLLVGYDRSELLAMQVDLAKGSAGIPMKLDEFDDLVYGLRSTADGKSVTAIRDRSQWDIYVGALSPSGAELTNIHRLTLDDSSDRPSSWVDDRTIVFHSNRNGRRGIYMQRIDESRAEPLVVDERENFSPVVSPDRQWLWYYSKPAGQDGANTPVKLMRRALAGGSSQEFDSRQDSWRSLSCSRSGKCIRIEHEGNESVFYSFDPQDGSGYELVRAPSIGPFVSYSWDLSPDGNRIAYVDRAGNRIGLIDLASPQRRTEVQVDWHQAPQGVSWNSDGTGLYVACFEEKDSSTLLITLDGNITLLRYQPTDTGAWAKPSPDGRHLLLADSARAGNVWLLERE